MKNYTRSLAYTHGVLWSDTGSLILTRNITASPRVWVQASNTITVPQYFYSSRRSIYQTRLPSCSLQELTGHNNQERLPEQTDTCIFIKTALVCTFLKHSLLKYPFDLF